MKNQKAVQLLLNEHRRDHGQVVAKLLKRAKRLECMVAFAKTSALDITMTGLEKALAGGLNARFAIGLDFYLTEPGVLRRLLKLSKNHALELYLSNSSATFHPKIYAFQSDILQCSVLIGSANLTYGGLSGNYEASAMIEDANGALMESVIRHFDELVTDEVIVPATKARIDTYEREYEIHDAYRKVAKKRAEQLSRTKTPIYALLREILELMKDDDSEEGFEAQRTRRKYNRRQATTVLENLAARKQVAKQDFLGDYEALIGLFHSGGLHRGKTLVAEHPDLFLAAMADIIDPRNLSPRDAFDVLHRHFSKIPRAGINLLTEILHALDNERFAVMNQNAVSGLALAGITDYPLHPTKEIVDGESYARYCRHADAVRHALGLADFTELDALFNYAYWRQAAIDDDSQYRGGPV